MSLTERTRGDGTTGPTAVRLPEGHRDAGAEGAGTAAPGGPPVGLGLLGWVRWTWRQLTSMRTALLLLLLLAVAAVPGSFLPQRGRDAVAVTQYASEHEALAPWLDRAGLFDVYSSPWFSAIYLLLFVSLVGCVLPRARVHARALRQAPPRTPASLARLPEHRSAEVDATPGAVLAAARPVLRGRRYRVAEFPASLAAQRGELRETGNLVFHLALVGVLVSVATSSLFGYRVQSLVPVGGAFVDSVAAFDTYEPGALVDPEDLPPFRFTLDSVHVRFDGSSAGNQFGAPRDFRAGVDVVPAPGAAARKGTIRVNDPLRIAGASVYLAGNGYAPVITVRDSTGQVAFSGAVPFLVVDAQYKSRGVVKVADALPRQLALQGFFLPTARVDPVLGPISTFPDARKPELVFAAFEGDLGVDGGVPQNAYTLDRSRMTQLRGADGTPFSASLAPGRTVALPGGRGSVTFDRVERYAGFTVEHDPARAYALVFALLSIAGLTVSLFVPRRRVWVRAVPAPGGRTLLEVGALARSEDPGLGAEADAVLAAVQGQLQGQLQEQVQDQVRHDTDHEPVTGAGAGSST